MNSNLEDSQTIKNNITMTIKLNIIKNATLKGWTVVKRDKSTFVLTKKISILKSDEKNTENLIDMLLDVKQFDN
jgi:hypothetical protein